MGENSPKGSHFLIYLRIGRKGYTPTLMIEDVEHHCGVGAIVDPHRKTNVAPFVGPMLRRMEHRGAGACGAGFIDGDRGMQVLHREGRARNVLAELEADTTSAIIHTLYRTNPHSKPHPFLTDYHGQRVSVAFNGNIPSTVLENNARTFLEEHGHACETRSDTELIARLISVHLADTKGDMMQVFRRLPEYLDDGAYNIVTLQDNGDVHALRDARGFHPLVLGETKDNLHVIASEDQAIRRVWDTARHVDVSRIKPGMAVRLGPGILTPEREQLFAQNPSHCSFEWAYFADFNATLDGARVYGVRRAFGQSLADLDAEDIPGWTNPIVVPVPDSARVSAEGYAERAQMRHIDILLKRPDAMRSFIAAQERERIIREKFDIDWSLMAGRDVVLIDDSLVRGTTMRTLLDILKQPNGPADANVRIHLRFAFPPIVAPCFYGIDFSKRSELLVPQFSSDAQPQTDVLDPLVLRDLANHLGAASIKFLPISAVQKAINMPGQEQDLCRGCFTGAYSTENTQQLYQLQLSKELQQRKVLRENP